MGEYTIIPGRVEEVLPSMFAEGDFDACLCDPPYLLEFMGKEFDRQHKKMEGKNDGQKMQAWHEGWAREVLRVLKPGAHMLAFGGTRTYHRLASAAEDVGFEVRDMLAWMHGQGFPKGQNLKPAQEPVLVARKRGQGNLSIDSCRIAAGPDHTKNCNRKEVESHWRLNDSPRKSVEAHPAGRWPANVLLSHHEACNEACHPDCPVRMLDEQSGELKSGRLSPSNNVKESTGWSGGSKTNRVKSTFEPNSGGASRFFYCSKVSPRERHLGGITCDHPTLKPISLCTYLATLLLPPPSSSPRSILIPFSGAGSEIIGALKAGWDEVYGIEQDEEYAAWAEARITAALEEKERA